MLIKSLQELKDLENQCLVNIIDHSCNLDFCKNSGGRCYYMSVVALFYNIKTKIRLEGFETILPFVNRLMTECLERDERIRVCSKLPLEIQKTYKTYMQLYNMTPYVENYEATGIHEGGSSFKLLLSFLLQSKNGVYPYIPKIQNNYNFFAEIRDYYSNLTLFNRFFKVINKRTIRTTY